jgi:aminodeoxyfutalosine deaminase
MSWPKIRAEADSPKKILRAAWVAPMVSPLVRDGAILFQGARVLGVGTFQELRKDSPDAEVIDAGNAVALPGLVNAHVHLELSTLHPPAGRPKDLAAWILNLMLNTPSTEEHFQAGVREGVSQCLKFGVTTVGDISRHCRLTRAILKDGPLRTISFGEVLAMAQRRGLFEERFAAATDTRDESDFLRVGISPHSPYSVETDGFARCLEFAERQGRPIATHLAETKEEAEFLAHHSGPFRRLWEDGIRAWDDKVPVHAGGPIRFAEWLGLLDYPSLLAHVNYCDDAELAILAKGQARVVYCPRTHEYFGHAPHRWREMLKRGINVAIGTDSCASSSDLNLVADLRLAHRQAPEIPVEEIWKMATTRAAAALDAGDEVGEGACVGSLRPRAAADFTVFGVMGTEPLLEILETQELPKSVWIGGGKV